jgi:hypothetical protein
MKNLFLAFLLFFTSMNFNSAFSMDSDFDERVAHYMSLGMSGEDATTIAFEELTGSGSSSMSSRHVLPEYTIDKATEDLIRQLRTLCKTPEASLING